MFTNLSLAQLPVLVVLMLAVASTLVFGQPGPILNLIDPLDTCHSTYKLYRNEDRVIFVGEVTESLTSVEVRSLQERGGSFSFKTRVTDVIKGHLDGDVTISTYWTWSHGVPELGKKYIFRGRLAKDEKPDNWVDADRWSFEVQKVPFDLLNRIVGKIRRVTEQKPQSQIEGILVRNSFAPNGIKKHYWYVSQYPRLVFDSSYSKSMPYVKIEILSEKNERFVTETDDVGWFTFDGIPAGKYKIRPMISRPFEMSLNSSTYSPSFEVEVNDYENRICGTKAIIGISYLGVLDLEIDLSNTDFGSLKGFSLCPVNTETGEILRDYPFTKPKSVEFDAVTKILRMKADHIPVGHYVLKISDGHRKIRIPESAGDTAANTFQVSTENPKPMKFSISN